MSAGKPLNADELRSSFLDFFVARDHRLASSASLVPEHPAAPLFTNAGMVQFLPVFFGEEPPLSPRATSAQKCLRVRGKHDDIEIVGRSTSHLTFFEMLGNFSFGDYFKEGAIQYAWEFLTETLGLEGERLWATVHTSDDEAAQIWQELVGLPAERIQRMGEDNFWEMGATGPCGPSSEIFYDKGSEHGADGGPARGSEERYVEIWNLVFMESNRLEDGSLTALPKRNIDTGAGLERILPIVQGSSSVFDTDVLRRLIGSAEELTRSVYGRDEEDDVSLRILADHARAVTFMLADGVVPSNLERGYVLRRIIRRAIRHGQRVGAREGMMAAMAATVTEVMGGAYPELGRSLGMVSDILEREEHRFVETLSLGLGMLEDLILDGVPVISGSDAFKLHDTYGFPVELTAEIAAERKVGLDLEGFEQAMAHQRELARSAAGGGSGDELQSHAAGRLVAELAGLGPTEFLGYEQLEAQSKLLRVLKAKSGGDRTARGSGTLEVFVERTPFYAESGGQVGDTGTIESETGTAHVIDTDRPLEGIIRHRVRLERAPSWRAKRRSCASTRPPGCDPAQPHRHPPAALGAAHHVRLAASAAGLARRARLPALRFQPPLAAQRRGHCADRRACDRRHPQRRARADDREHARGRARRGGDVVLRRQVRRDRARGARGRAFGRAVRRHARVRARAHRRLRRAQRVLGRRQPAPYRGSDRQGGARRPPARARASAHRGRVVARGARFGARGDRPPANIAQPGGTPAQGAGRQRRPRTGSLTCRLRRRREAWWHGWTIATSRRCARSRRSSSDAPASELWV